MSSLSTKQLRILGMEATQAFDRLAKHDALELPGEVVTCSKSAQRDFWRQRVCAEVTGFCSFKDLNQDHYRPLLSRFQALAGNTGGAFKTQLREERGAAATTPGGAGLVRDLWHHAAKAGLGEAYVATITRAKFKTTDLASLSMRQLKQIHDTVLKRARQKLGQASKDEETRRPGDSEKGSAAAPSKSRAYVLRKPSNRVHSTASQRPDLDALDDDNNEPF